MTRPRHLIMSVTLAVAFLSAGAFGQDRVSLRTADAGVSPVNVTVISKS